jgi:hypothetical protein
MPAAAEGAFLRCHHVALDRSRSEPLTVRRLELELAVHHADSREGPSPLPPRRANPRSFGAVGRSSLLPSASSPITMMTQTRSRLSPARTTFS